MAEEFDWDRDFRRLMAESEGISIRDLVVSIAALEHKAIEEMAERMLVSPEPCGIVVVLNQIISLDDPYAPSRSFRLDPNVPFGHMYEFPSMEAYELWQERGHPKLR